MLESCFHLLEILIETRVQQLQLSIWRIIDPIHMLLQPHAQLLKLADISNQLLEGRWVLTGKYRLKIDPVLLHIC